MTVTFNICIFEWRIDLKIYSDTAMRSLYYLGIFKLLINYAYCAEKNA